MFQQNSKDLLEKQLQLLLRFCLELTQNDSFVCAKLPLCSTDNTKWLLWTIKVLLQLKPTRRMTFIHGWIHWPNKVILWLWIISDAECCVIWKNPDEFWIRLWTFLSLLVRKKGKRALLIDYCLSFLCWHTFIIYSF